LGEKVIIVYSIYSDGWSDDRKTELDVGSKIIDSLKDWNNPHKAMDFLENEVKEFLCSEWKVKEHNLKILEVYKKEGGG
jgi:hypothetical protein